MTQKYTGFEFAAPLVCDMVHDDPAKRPTIDQVVARFADMRRMLSTKTLRSRLVGKDEDEIDRFFKGFVHSVRTTSYILRSIPPVPK